MFKKGIGGHVDWIIGIGLFLIYVAMLFAFFKPGITDVFEPDTLLDIVEDGFTADSAWELQKTPIFLEGLPEYQCLTGEPPEPASIPYDSKVSYFHLDGVLESLGEIFTTEDFALELGDDDDHFEVFYVPEDVTEDLCAIFTDDYATDQPEVVHYCDIASEDRPYSVMYEYDGSSLTLPTPDIFDEGVQLKYVLIHSEEEEINTDHSGGIPGVILEDNCEPVGDIEMNHFPACQFQFEYDAGLYEDEYGDYSEPTCFAQYSLGVTETLFGIEPDGDGVNFVDTSGCTIAPVDDYLCAKELWGFPELKEFKIAVTSTALDPNTIWFPDNTYIPGNVRVDSRLFNSYLLSDNGVRTPAEINILVW